jgi:hypothetical protein
LPVFDRVDREQSHVFFLPGHTTVSNAVFTHYTAPVFVAALAPLLISNAAEVTLISSVTFWNDLIVSPGNSV